MIRAVIHRRRMEEHMKLIQDIAYSDIGHPRQKLDLYLPDAKEFSVFIYFHGGGLERGSKEGQPFIEYLVKRGIAVVSALCSL